jgi:hypothetical protein
MEMDIHMEVTDTDMEEAAAAAVTRCPRCARLWHARGWV